MTRKTLLAVLTATALCVPFAAGADDTDIYFSSNSRNGTAPLIMFSIDYRSNLTSNVCTSTAPGQCPAADFFRSNGLTADLATLPSLNLFDVMRLALKVVLLDPVVQNSGAEIGLMFNHNQNNGCVGFLGDPPPTKQRCSNGGVILRGFKALESNDSNGSLSEFMAKLNALKTLKPKSSSPDHPYQGSELFFEFFRYLTGQDVYNGHDGWTDFEQGNSVDLTTNMRCPDSLDGVTNTDTTTNPACFDSSIEDHTNPTPRYQSPLSNLAACAKIFTINFLFQVSQSESESQPGIEAAKTAQGLGIKLPPSQNDWFATVLGFLHDSDLADGSFGPHDPNIDGIQNVTSYFFVDPTKINNTTTGYAIAGGTDHPLPLTSDAQTLVDQLRNVFRQILSVSTTFVAASVPVNVFNRAQIVNNVYVALFQADRAGKPAWNGDVKKLELQNITLADGSKSQELVDALGNPAVAGDGRIEVDALTFWTDPNGRDLPADTQNNVPAGRDGRSVNRGGVGQKIPGFLTDTPTSFNTDAGARQLFYNGASGLTAFNADNPTAAAVCPNVVDSLRSLFAATATVTCATIDVSEPLASNPTTTSTLRAEIIKLLKWTRGVDVDDSDNDGSTTDSRPWLFNDPLHSRPLPINYGALSGFSSSNPAIYIAVASNDGFLRFIRNTDAGTTGSDESGSGNGREVWAFMPQKVMGKLQTLRANTQTTPPHPYLFDGAPTALIDDVNQDGTIESGDHVYLYVGMRRGGHSYYAFDVTNPLSPSLLWKITSATSGFSELGLTFSTPQVGKISVNGTTKSVVVFAGGYDTNKDQHVLGSDDSTGNAIYVVDAITGALIWKAAKGATTGPVNSTTFAHADLTDSIPADVVIVDTDGDGLVDRILFGDTGGQVWRADVSGNTSNWKLTRLANLGRHFANDKTDDRRFFTAPDLVQHRDQNGPYDAVIIGSGDREDPLDRGGVTQNWFYVIKDRNIAVFSATTDLNRTPDDLGDVTDNCLQTLSCTVNPNLTNGWRLMLNQGVGEKDLSAPLTFSNTIFFSTFLPPGSNEVATCGPSEGSGLLYALDLDNATAVFNFSDATPGKDRTDVLKSGGIPSQVVFLPPGEVLGSDLGIRPATTSNRFPTFWQRVDPKQ